MNVEQTENLLQNAYNIIRCWAHIKDKARRRGDITNIEKHAPCITQALNNMEIFLAELEKHRDEEATAIVNG